MNKNIIYASVTIFLWGLNSAIVKLLMFSMSNLQALGIGSAIAFVFLLILNIVTGKIKLLKQYKIKDCIVMAGLGFLGLFMYSALYYYGIANLTSQQATVINYLWPIMIVIFSMIILKEKMTVGKILALICSFLGIVVLTVGIDMNQGTGNVVMGIAACIAAAVCYGLFSVLNKKADYDQNIAMMIIWLVTSVCSFVLGSFTVTWVSVSGNAWIGLLWIGLGADALAYLFWALALNGAKNTVLIANLAYLVPFLAVIFAGVILKEQIKPNTIIALVLIVGGILIQSFLEKRQTQNH